MDPKLCCADRKGAGNPNAPYHLQTDDSNQTLGERHIDEEAKENDGRDRLQAKQQQQSCQEQAGGVCYILGIYLVGQLASKHKRDRTRSDQGKAEIVANDRREALQVQDGHDGMPYQLDAAECQDSEEPRAAGNHRSMRIGAKAG